MTQRDKKPIQKKRAYSTKKAKKQARFGLILILLFVVTVVVSIIVTLNSIP
ncbi:MAG: hypothetical protein ACFFKA_17610 [Candidatus Thorarchaeota archaeon]